MVRFDTSVEQERIDHPLLRPLWDDMVQCERLLEANDCEFTRRTYYRSAFSFIEGYVYWLKDVAMRNVLHRGLSQGPADIALASALLDESARINKTGKLSFEPNRIPFLHYVALIVRTLAEQHDLDAGGFFADNGWRELQDAVRVRHRITHPKTPQGLNMTDEEMDHLRGAMTWILNCTIRVVNRLTRIEQAAGRSGDPISDKDK